jgi:hypothetical protein
MEWNAVRQIHSDYLRLIDEHFGRTIHELRSSPLTIEGFVLLSVGESPASRKSSALAQSSIRFRDEARRFWQAQSPVLAHAIERHGSLAGVAWGDTSLPDTIRRFGLYYDTVFLPDSLPHFTNYPDGTPPIEHIGQFLRWALILKELEPALLAHCEPLPVVIFPQQFSLSEDIDTRLAAVRDGLKVKSDRLALDFLTDAFGGIATGSDVHSLFEDLRRKPLSEIARQMKADSLVAFIGPLAEAGDLVPRARDMGIQPSLVSKIKSRTLSESDLRRIFPAAESLSYMLTMRDANSQLVGAANTHSSMMWPVALWRNEVLRMTVGAAADLPETAVASYSFEHQFEWMSGLTIQDLVELRCKGALSGLRDVLRVSLADLRTASSGAFPVAARSFEDSVVAQIEDRRAEIAAINAQTARNMKRTAGSFGATLILGGTSLALPALMPLAVGATLFGVLVGSASAKDLVSSWRERKELLNAEGERPIDFLMDVHARGIK